MPDLSKEHTLWHQSGVSKDGRPFIQLFLNDELLTQLTIWEARDHAKNLIETAEGAETDAFLMEFLREELQAPDEAVAAVMIAFRKFREARGKAGPPSNPDEFKVVKEQQRPKT